MRRSLITGKIVLVIWAMAGLELVRAQEPTVADYQVTLAWDANPEPDISGYRLHFGTEGGNHPNTVDVGNVTTSPLSLPGVGTYYAVVTAYNTAGLESLPSNEVAFTIQASNIPPSVSLSTPVAGSTLEAPASITMTAVATDSDGAVAKVAFYGDGVILGEVLAGSPFSYDWRNLAPGNHYLMARAFDDAGATTDSATLSVTVVDRTLPVIVGIPGDISVAPDAAGGSTAVVSWAEPAASDLVGVASFSSTHESGDTFPAGTTNVIYTAVDAAGNVATASFKVTVTSIELWRQASFGSDAYDPLTAGDNANPDGDRWDNLAEYVLGLNPLAWDGGSATSLDLSPDALHFHLSHAPHLPDILLIIESFTPPSAEWSQRATRSPTYGWTLNSPDIEISTISEGGRQGVTLTRPIAGDAGEFFRLRMVKLGLP